MNFIYYSSFIFLGLVSGILGGFVGIGGGIVLVPSLVLFYGFNQHLAQGTSLAALVPPVGLLAAYIYYKNGSLDFYAAILISVGFLLGAFFGAKFSNQVSQEVLQRFFGSFLILVGIKMAFFSK